MEHFQLTDTTLCALLLSTILLKFSVGIDTLLPNQTIVVGQTLVSESHVFEMGFFSPGKSRNRFLGIWYKSTPEVVVWVANRNDPIPDSGEALFAIAENRTLVISRAGCVIWSTNASGVASDPILQLLDTGNLVLVDRESESAQGYIWQSFDYPTDTWLPGMKMIDDIDAGVEKYLTSWKEWDDPSPGDFILKIENQGLPEMVMFRGRMKRYRSGQWNGIHFSGVPPFPNASFKPEMVFKGERLICIVEPYDSSILKRVTMETSGTGYLYTMNAKKDKWNPVYSNPRDPCDEYGQCGPYGVCRIDRVIKCECFKGFAPKSQQDWDLQDWSHGCTRTRPLNCEGGDGFVEVRGVKYPDMLQLWLNYSMSLSECRAECLRNCNCSAYANPYITNGGSGCLIWFGDLIDTRDFIGIDSKQNIYIRVSGLEISGTEFNIDLEKEKGNKRPIKLILISMVSGVLVSGFINGAILLMTRRKRRAAQKKNEDLELPVFKWTTIVAATNNFSRENIIGEGGFGPVYRGNLSAEEEIAVKRLSRTSGQGLEEFKTEVILIAKLQHRNLVRLLGCCIEGEERMLIYEYLPNKSLDRFVFDQNQRILLTWPKRFDIIMGIARGLLYLHHDSRLKIIHRDLKTSNILLDGNLNPKISDFGLARTFGENQSTATTKRVVGTYGYMAPEYAMDGKFSVKSDIFSIGVVLLEIVSGRKNRGFDHCTHCHSLLGHELREQLCLNLKSLDSSWKGVPALQEVVRRMYSISPSGELSEIVQWMPPVYGVADEVRWSLADGSFTVRSALQLFKQSKKRLSTMASSKHRANLFFVIYRNLRPMSICSLHAVKYSFLRSFESDKGGRGAETARSGGFAAVAAGEGEGRGLPRPRRSSPLGDGGRPATRAIAIALAAMGDAVALEVWATGVARRRPLWGEGGRRGAGGEEEQGKGKGGVGGKGREGGGGGVGGGY
ncbi:UNVERIFIED_CONTAM: G-type lectin S-receptor-like serine/threonine-protein kinase [Sesamum latifolium]|uniref:G-type lectin S-receptor-like serine/threonine-protein kinase n=1 Tax=Sesamum latifolium TaxID=2727402 RepID=A0AAW2TPK1_9LAMI